MTRRRRTNDRPSSPGEPVAPLARTTPAVESELDEYINLGEKTPEEDPFDDIPEPEETEEEDDAAPIPRIARDTKLEEEIEREKYVPIEKLVADVPEISQSLDPVRIYLREIGRHPLLTAEEELELAQEIKQGLEPLARVESAIGELESHVALSTRITRALDEIDKIDDPAELDELEVRLNRAKRAHNRLTQSNLRLVVSVAKRYIGRGLNFLDLIQEGNVGLIRAVDKFDHTLGFKFSTYATWWIRQAITRSIADQARTIRIPVHMIEVLSRLRNVSKRLLQELGREPTTEETAHAADITVDETRRVLSIGKHPVSLDRPVGESEDSSFGEFIEDNGTQSPLSAAGQGMLRDKIENLLKTLTFREREIIRLRYGLGDGYTYTLEEVGRIFRVTRERVRQIEAKAVRKLQHPVRSKQLEGFLEGIAS